MTSQTKLILPQIVYKTISDWADKAYPHEGCGLLIGEFEANGLKRVKRFALLTNVLLTKIVNNSPTLPQERQGEGAGKTEFVIDPGEFNKESLQAEKEGLDVIGVVHTHPDHPPKPSKIDASQPFLSQWSNIIVSVQQGSTKEMKSWFRDTDEDPFSEEPIEIQ